MAKTKTRQARRWEVGYYEPPKKPKSPRHKHGRWVTYKDYKRKHAAIEFCRRYNRPEYQHGASGLRVRLWRLESLMGLPVWTGGECTATKFLVQEGHSEWGGQE